MDTERVTREEFEEIKQPASKGSSRSPESARALNLPVGEGVRFKKHSHKLVGGKTDCRVATAIRQTAKNNDLKITTKHDGPDLVVFRLS